METNPFTFGNPIKSPERFVGRKEEVRQIASRLLSSAHESTSIVGERRIGKTSFLYYLSNPDVASGLGISEDEYCVAYIDFQGLSDITPEKFWNRVLGKVQKKIRNEDLISQIKEIRAQENIDLFDLEDLFEAISDHGLHVVLMLDEFEYVTQNPNFQVDFFGGLRALAIHSNLTLITSTSKELVDLCHSEEIKGSPFFNIFATVVLRAFSEQETADFISTYSDLGGEKFTDEEIDFISQYGGGSPIFLQMAGHYLFDVKRADTESENKLSEAAKKFGEQASQHFSYYWSQTSESEKITLLSILAYSSAKRKKGQAPTLKKLAKLNPQALIDTNALARRGLINEREDTYSVFSPGFGSWIGYEIASQSVDKSEISVDEWLKTSGQVSASGSVKVLPKFKSKYWPLITKLTKEFSFELVENVFFGAITGGMF